MSLKNILLDISSEFGLDITDPDEQLIYIEKINEAARELYTSADLPGSILEQIFQLDDTDNYQVSFPFYIDKIRGIRFYNTYGSPITLEDLRPRYNQKRWDGSNRLRYRIKYTSPLAVDITNASKITFTLPTGRVETEDVVINIVGDTVDSFNFQEKVTISVGQSSATSTGDYEKITNLEKNDYSKYNLTLTDIDNRTLGIIPSSELSPIYTIVQIREDDLAPYLNGSYPLNLVEVLYKKRFTPFRNLYDEFPCPNCDKIIFWKFVEHYLAKQPGMEQRAAMANTKVNILLSELSQDDEKGKHIQATFGEGAVYRAQRGNSDGLRMGMWDSPYYR